jgi:hypothetical protein
MHILLCFPFTYWGATISLLTLAVTLLRSWRWDGLIWWSLLLEVCVAPGRLPVGLACSVAARRESQCSLLCKDNIHVIKFIYLRHWFFVFTFWLYVWQLDPGHTYDEHLILASKPGVTAPQIPILEFSPSELQTSHQSHYKLHWESTSAVWTFCPETILQ